MTTHGKVQTITLDRLRFQLHETYDWHGAAADVYVRRGRAWERIGRVSSRGEIAFVSARAGDYLTNGQRALYLHKIHDGIAWEDDYSYTPARSRNIRQRALDAVDRRGGYYVVFRHGGQGYGITFDELHNATVSALNEPGSVVFGVSEGRIVGKVTADLRYVVQRAPRKRATRGQR